MPKMKSLRGFTLVEMAIVLVLFGIVTSMGLKMVTANLDNAAYSETKSKQERIKAALISYLRTNGRLPCPDITSTPTGLEPSSGCATPASGYGVLPWQTLGLARDAALDGWKNFFTYRVSDINPASSAPATPAVPRAQNSNQNWTQKTSSGFNILSINSPTTGGFSALEIDQRNGSSTPAIAYNAVVVIYSHGKNGLGATAPKGTVNTAPAGADEIINSTSGTARFIINDITSIDTGYGVYDDIVAYLTPQDLLQPLVNEGTLKTCNAYCTASTPVFSCSRGYPSDHCGTAFCAALGPACTSGDVPSCSSNETPQCLSVSLVNCTPTGITIGNPNINCP